MTIDTFVLRRQQGWQELERCIATARGGALRDVSAKDLERFGILYRRSVSDLAIARRDFPDEDITEYLNGLCARAHPLLYRGSPLRLGSLPSFYATGLPRDFRAAKIYVVASLVLSLVGVLAGWLAVALRPDLAATLIPHSLFDQMARGEVPTGGLDNAGFTAGFIIQNNIRVALLCFAGGALLGLPTVYVLLLNGWTLGTLAAAVHRDGFDVPFWSFIVPHGVIELSVIIFAGATGLMLGDAVLRPGLLSRADSLSRVSGRAVGLAVGAASLLVIAGIIEGYISPSGLPEAAKYFIGGASAILLYSWLLLAGRPQRSRPQLSLERVTRA
jgi:uncharacterized membrane protein SpoIIM required for sporulation